MEQQQLFRKKSLERISSPDQLDEYLHVTNPSLWFMLIAVILILAGMMAWASFASLESYAGGKGVVVDGTMTIHFDDVMAARNVQEGMEVRAGRTTTTIKSIGQAEDGSMIAVADSELHDGSYEVQVRYRTTQVLKLLFN